MRGDRKCSRSRGSSFPDPPMEDWPPLPLARGVARANLPGPEPNVPLDRRWRRVDADRPQIDGMKRLATSPQR